MEEKKLVSDYGVFTTIAVTVVGVGVFSFPRDISKAVGTDGWISMLLSGFLCFFITYIMYKSSVINGYKDLNDIMEYSFGRIVGLILVIAFASYLVFYASLSMRIFIEVIKMYLLEKTPAEFLILITIFTATYLIRGEFDSLLKFNEISFWIMFVSIAFVLIFTLNKTDFTNILPVLARNPRDYISSIKLSIFSFSGFEIIYLLAPRAQNRSKLSATLFKSLMFVAVFYSIIFIFVIAVFTKSETMKLMWPTITMIKSIDIPGSFIERWEGIVMTLWIIFFFTTFTNIYYFSSEIVKKAFRINDIRISLAIVMPFLYLATLYPQNIAKVYDLIKFVIPPIGVVFYIVIPLLLLIIGLRRHMKDRGGSVI